MIKQRHVAALIGEFLGTATLVLVVLSVLPYRFPFFTAIAAGVTVAVFVSAFTRYGGGHVNPVVTIGLFAIRKVSALRAIGFLVMQFAGAFGAMKLYEFITGNELSNITIAGTDWKVATAEFVGAFIFGIAVASVVTQKIEGYQAVYTIGAGLFLGMLVASLASSSLLNPAVALGIQSFDWIEYVAAPVVGAIVAMGIVAFGVAPIVRKNKTSKPAVKAVASEGAKKEEKAPVATKAASTKKAPAKKAPAKKAPAKKAPANKK